MQVSKTGISRIFKRIVSHFLLLGRLQKTFAGFHSMKAHEKTQINLTRSQYTMNCYCNSNNYKLYKQINVTQKKDLLIKKSRYNLANMLVPFIATFWLRASIQIREIGVNIKEDKCVHKYYVNATMVGAERENINPWKLDPGKMHFPVILLLTIKLKTFTSPRLPVRHVAEWLALPKSLRSPRKMFLLILFTRTMFL